MNLYAIRVTGMTCDHCARTVEKALGTVPGVTVAQVSYAEGTARVETRDRLECQGHARRRAVHARMKLREEQKH